MDAVSAIFFPPRRREPEWMDQPDLDEGSHLLALDGLRRLNRWSRTAQTLWSPIKRLAGTDPTRRWKVLDVACGGGDVAIRVARSARSCGLSLTVDGCDVNRRAVAHSSAQARARHLDDMAFFEHDALVGDLPVGYDIVMCSLFLHHLNEEQAAGLLQRMSSAAGRLVLVSDLRRGWFGNLLVWLACHALTRSPVVHCDGPRSARAAFTLEEARNLALRAGLSNARIERSWPQRFLLHWRR